jgi:hypothetical protein
MSGLLNRGGPISRMVGGGIGFAQEYNADRKARKARSASPNPETAPNSDGRVQNTNQNAFYGQSSSSSLAPPPAYGQGYSSAEDSDSEDDEEWAHRLDDMSIPLQDQYAASNSMSPEQVADAFLRAHPPPPYGMYPPQGPAKLPLPVIIPQRRPESRHRGFVRAYAPVLQDVSIDETTWLSFLDGFEKSIKANPVFHVMNFGVFLAEHVHIVVSGFSPITMAAALALHLAFETARRGYVHYKQNGYLDKMNDEFFKPRGLYCLVISYKPDQKAELIEDINVETNIAQQVDQRNDPERSKWKNLIHSSSGTTTHDSQIPESAPLVFPELDNMNESQKQNAIKQFGSFASDYFDRRAQAKFHAENPNSILPEVPMQEFASRYSDPNHPASQGGLISIASGGKVNPVGPVGRMRQKRMSKKGIDPSTAQTLPQKLKERKKKSPMKKALKQDAVYLMVVNLPSQEEMDIVRAAYEGRA